MKVIVKILAVVIIPVLLFVSCGETMTLVISDIDNTYLIGQDVPMDGVSTSANTRTKTFTLANIGEQRLTFTSTPALLFDNDSYSAYSTAYEDTDVHYTVTVQPDVTYLDPGTTADVTILLSQGSIVAGDTGTATADLRIEAQSESGSSLDFVYSFYGEIC